MKIAILAPPWFAVPPDGYGGIEWVVSTLADGLVDRGHDVTLHAAGGSRTRARLVATYPDPPSARIGQSLPDLRHALALYAGAEDHDVVNDHSGPLGAALGGLAAAAVCHTVHGPLMDEPAEVYAGIARVAPAVGLISVSESQRARRPELPWIATCHNAIDLAAYPFDPGDDGYLLFLGRMTADKGAHHAVAVARELGMPLLMAGKASEPAERAYFDAHVRPGLGDGIEYVGEVSHDEKVRLLQRARVTLFPIQWPEPFGLVPVESMACGTPVVAMRHGAVPEVVEHGRCGIVVDRPDELAAAVEEAARLDPREGRAVAEERFSPARMVSDYERAYELLLARGPAVAAPT